MTRDEFLDGLRTSLAGFGKRDVDEILADYDEYFREAAAVGRSEAAVAKALGSPRQLARLLQIDARIQAWESNRSPRTLAGMVLSIAGVGLLNLFMIGPIMALTVFLFGLFACAATTFCAGIGLVLASVPSIGLHRFVRVDVFGSDVSDPAAMAAVGVGMLCTGLIWFLVNMKLSRWFGNGLARYVRFNQRLLPFQ